MNHQWQTPDLQAVSPFLLVPFEVVKLRSPRIAWVNTRWFSDQGIGTQSMQEREAVGRWLLDEFGFVVDQAEYSDLQLERSVRRTFHADRYGSNNGLVAHGGSGRGAAIGHFHVKGIGQTPLLGRGVNREHSHGAASLNVAIREAVYAEVCDEEFPFGAVPVVAIIDTGLDFESSAKPGRRLRRALLVRPSVLRPSHMQRAAGFIDPLDGHINSQVDDAYRVRDVIRHFVECSGGAESAASALSLHCVRLASQVAFGQVHRLYNGGYFSSNLSMDARILDFGNMHAPPNWVNAKVLDRDLGFGHEMRSLEATLRSLEFHFRKYAPAVAFDAPATLDAARLSYERSFDRECARVLGMDGPGADDAARSRAVAALRVLFERQQGVSRYYGRSGESRDGWPSAWLKPEDRSDADAPWAASYEQIEHEALAGLEGLAVEAGRAAFLMTTNRFLSPRKRLARRALQDAVDQLLQPFKTAPLGDHVGRFIDCTVAFGRRHWPALPTGFIVRAHAYRAGHSVLEGDLGEDTTTYWLEGYFLDCSARLFDETFSTNHLYAAGAALDGFRWRLRVPAAQIGDGAVSIGGAFVPLPAMQVRYDRPS